MTDQPTPASLRDVVDLVTDTRQEINTSIATLVGKFDAFVTTNERRLTTLEVHYAAQQQQLANMDSRLARHGQDIGSLKDQQKRDEAVTDAFTKQRSSRWSVRERVLIALCTVLMATGALLLAFHL